jgi:hypothetical protein
MALLFLTLSLAGIIWLMAPPSKDGDVILGQEIKFDNESPAKSKSQTWHKGP